MISIIRKAFWVTSWHWHLVRIRIAIVLRRIEMLCGSRNFIVNISPRPELYESKKIAIIAIYPIDQKFYVDSLKNLLIGLSANGIAAIGVINGEIPIQIEKLLQEFNCSLLRRKNKGRDFGAYQDGFNWLLENIDIDSIDRIIFVNDTLLWISSSEQIVKDCLKENWAALYFNLEQHAHAQSFFLCFSRNVIQNKKFKKFWKNYAATKYRRAAIIFGEMGLSSLLLKEGFSCNPLVNSNWIHSKFEESREVSSYIEILNLLEINPLWKVDVPGASKHGMSVFEGSRKLEDFAKCKALHEQLGQGNRWTPLVLSQYCHSQGPHRVGLILYLLFGLPLKADLYKANSLAEIYSVVSIRNPEVAHSAHEFYSQQAQRYMLGTRKNNRLKRRGEK